MLLYETDIASLKFLIRITVAHCVVLWRNMNITVVYNIYIFRERDEKAKESVVILIRS
jgi:hypothetical protein